MEDLHLLQKGGRPEMDLKQTNRHTVLYVDRDPSACERFREAFANSYDVLIATSAAEAWAATRSSSRDLAVVIVDGGVSDETGARLLARFRRDAPEAVRVLASDSGNPGEVVEAVNECEVYQCLRKPWEAKQLGSVLGAAVERFERERQKRLLLEEKLCALERIIGAGQEFGALVLGEALSPWLQRSLPGATAFVEWRRAKEDARRPSWEGSGLGEIGYELARAALDEVRRVVDALALADRDGPEGAVSLGGVLRRALRSADPAGTATVENTGVPVEILTHRRSVENLFASLLRCLVQSATQGVSIHAHHSAEEPEGVRVHLRVREGQALQAAGSADLLAAFLLAHHLGGAIQVYDGPPEGPGFDVLLPRQPEVGEARTAAIGEPTGIEALLRRLQTPSEPPGWTQSAKRC
jgi:CheY-like chemotaxis protein